jgi:hypothetical protein
LKRCTQVASLLIFDGTPSAAAPGCAWLRGVDNAKFRRQVVPGDRLQLDVTMGRRARQHRRAQSRPRRSTTRWWLRPSSSLRVEGGRMRLADIHPTAIVHP